MDNANLNHGSGPAPDDPLLASPLFDAAHYGGLAGVDGTRAGLLAHYLAEGEARGLSPSDAFDVGLYAFLNPDVMRYNGSPLRHYATYGRAEHRYATRATLAADARAVEESGLFDESVFARHLGQLPHAGLSLAEEYLAARDGNAPIGPAFDGGFYRDAYPDVQDHPGLPVLHYIRIGRAERRVATSAELKDHMAGCRASFQEGFYRTQLPPGSSRTMRCGTTSWRACGAV